MIVEDGTFNNTLNLCVTRLPNHNNNLYKKFEILKDKHIHPYIHTHTRWVCAIDLIWENTRVRQTCWVYSLPCWTHAKDEKTLKKFANPFWNITIVFPFFRDHNNNVMKRKPFAFGKRSMEKIPEYIIHISLVKKRSIHILI